MGRKRRNEIFFLEYPMFITSLFIHEDNMVFLPTPHISLCPIIFFLFLSNQTLLQCLLYFSLNFIHSISLPSVSIHLISFYPANQTLRNTSFNLTCCTNIFKMKTGLQCITLNLLR